MKCEKVPHTVRLTDREVNIINALKKQNGSRISEIIRAAIVLYGGSYGIRTNADGKVI